MLAEEQKKNYELIDLNATVFNLGIWNRRSEIDMILVLILMSFKQKKHVNDTWRPIVLVS